MSKENLQNEAQFRRFLLGEMTENERTEFEESFILNEEIFENLRLAEDELIENYVRGTLEVSEKNKFEKNFLTTAKRCERVEFTRQMLDKFEASKQTVAVAETVSIWTKLAALFQQPQFAFGSALAILLLLLGGWFLWRNANKPVDIVTVTPTPTPQVSITPTPQTAETPRIDSNVNQPNKSNNENINQRPNVNKPSPTVEPTPKKVETERPVIVTLALFAGGVRSGGATNELNLSNNTGGANLQLNLENQDYKTYRAEIVDQNGSIIYRSKTLLANKAKVNVFVSPQKLKRGDYIVRLYGKNAKNEDESVADFQFRVNQK